MGRADEAVGTSQADLPSYSATFSIKNHTGATIAYQVRWGNGSWKSISLANGHVETHRYSIGADVNAGAPQPSARFENGQGSTKTYNVAFNTVGYAGFGPD
jgi:hypothetical protein